MVSGLLDDVARSTGLLLEAGFLYKDSLPCMLQGERKKKGKKKKVWRGRFPLIYGLDKTL